MLNSKGNLCKQLISCVHLGAVLDAAKRIQVNLRLTQYSHLSELAKVPPVTMLPVYWVAQVGTITPELASEFKSAVYSVEYGIEGGMWAITGIAGIVDQAII